MNEAFVPADDLAGKLQPPRRRLVWRLAAKMCLGPAGIFATMPSWMLVRRSGPDHTRLSAASLLLSTLGAWVTGRGSCLEFPRFREGFRLVCARAMVGHKRRGVSSSRLVLRALQCPLLGH